MLAINRNKLNDNVDTVKHKIRIHIRNRYMSKLFAICMIVLTLFCISCDDRGGSARKKGKNVIYSEVAELFIKIIDEKDVEGLVNLGWPDSRDFLKTELNDKKSTLRDVFFGKGHSIRTFIKKAKMLDYEIITYPSMPEYGTDEVNEIDIIFYDKSKINSLRELKVEELRQLWSDEIIIIITFMEPVIGHEPPGHIKGQWYMDFSGHPFLWSLLEDDLKRIYPFHE